jgi:hypothetical protein
VSGDEMRHLGKCLSYVASAKKGSVRVMDDRIRVSDLSHV